MGRSTIAIGILVAALLACGGVGGPDGEEALAPAEVGEFVQIFAEAKQDESYDKVPCLTSTLGETMDLGGWRYTYGTPKVFDTPEAHRKAGAYTVVLPVTIENRKPKKRSHTQDLLLTTTDGADARRSKGGGAFDEALGKPVGWFKASEIAPMKSEDRYYLWFVDDKDALEGAGLYTLTVYDRFAGTSNYALEVEEHRCIELSGIIDGGTLDVAAPAPRPKPSSTPRPPPKKRTRK